MFQNCDNPIFFKKRKLSKGSVSVNYIQNRIFFTLFQFLLLKITFVWGERLGGIHAVWPINQLIVYNKIQQSLKR